MLDTLNLVKKLKLQPCTTFVVNLKLNYNLNGTHAIYIENDNIYDTGIDDNKLEWTIDEFLKNYHNATWEIEQIIT